MKHEFTQLGLWAAFLIGAAVTAHAASLPLRNLISTSLLAISMSVGGWLGHNYLHGVDDFANEMRNFAAYAAGLGPMWWSDKHNKHRAFMNE